MKIEIAGVPTTIDSDDYEKVMSIHWLKGGKNGNYLGGWVKGKGYYTSLHRYITGCTPNDGNIVDHINRDTTDNRKSNLRFVTNRENTRNRNISVKNKTGYHGVCEIPKRKDGRRWRAYAQNISGDTKHLGCYRTPEKAAIARDLFMVKEYGKSCTKNIRGAI